ncbi:MAG: TlpA disulfide reductase family protein [Pseudonocardiaceae bacterium]
MRIRPNSVDGRGRAGIVVSAFVCAALFGGCATARPAGPKADAAPVQFSARTLGGTQVWSLADQKGHPVLLSSWATWCGPCREELPELQKLSDQEQTHGLHVLGVDVDDGSDAAPLQYIRQHDLSFPMVHDTDNSFQATFLSLGVPYSVLIDSNGRVVHKWPGALDVEAALPEIKKAENG